jgi:hypothetical protein
MNEGKRGVEQVAEINTQRAASLLRGERSVFQQPKFQVETNVHVACASMGCLAFAGSRRADRRSSFEPA